MAVRVQKGGCMVDTLGHLNLGPNVVFETIVRPIANGRPREAPSMQRVRTEASSRAQILAQDRESSP